MTDAGSKPSFGARLARAVGGLVLALLNATLLLFIVAAILGLVLIGKVRTLATDVAGDVTSAAISSTGLDPADTLAELRLTSSEMAELRTTIAEHRDDLDERVQALDERLAGIQAKIRVLRQQKIALTDAVIDKAANAASTAATTAANDILKTLRACRAPADTAATGS
jgi:uncharacterized protein YdcH (DUF465 family)